MDEARGNTGSILWARVGQYLEEIQSKQPPRDSLEENAIEYGWCDRPHRTLRITTENLRSWNYSEYERDPVKYDLYTIATAKALRNWKEQSKRSSDHKGQTVLLIAGAGRGPLVSFALKAAASENVSVDIWAIERNPDVYATLQRRNLKKWGGVVKVVYRDMRNWEGPCKVDPRHGGEVHYAVDMVISELIGSFGDNGLSPESHVWMASVHYLRHGASPFPAPIPPS